jgi:hypothetical protein
MRPATVAALLIAAVVLAIPQAASAASFSATCNGGACSGGWYRSNVTVVLSYVPDAGKQVASASGCGSHTVSTDTRGASFTCTIVYVGGGGAFSPTVTVRRDATPPSVHGTLARGPDANGWYNHPVAGTFSGDDATSGIASCTSSTYSGPDSENASVGGACTDNAGNHNSGSVSLKYDATPPKLSVVSVLTNDRYVSLRWEASPDATSVQVVRTPGTSGSDPSTVYTGTASHFEDRGVVNHVKYEYAVTATDQAGNQARTAVDAVPAPALYAPAQGAKVHGAPTLAWVPYAGATYYNVQLFRGSTKILSAWPRHPKYRLARAWTFNRRRYRLRPGVYSWRVWPGLGKRKAHRYGPLLGHSDFTVAP